MKGVLFRLFLCWDVAFSLFVMCILMGLLSVVCGTAEDLWVGAGAAGVRLYGSSAGLRVHIALLFGVIIGVVSNYSLQDVAYCRCSWTFGGLHSGLRRELSWLALGTALLSALVSGVFGGGFDHIAASSLTLLGFGLGTMAWDFHLGKPLSIVAQLSVILVLGTSRRIGAGLESHAFLALPLGLLICLLAIRRSTSQAAMRTRALVPGSDLGASFKSPQSTDPYDTRKLEGRPGWTGGRIQSTAAWTRALLFEDAGWARGSWAGRSSVIAVVLALATALVALGFGVHEGGTLANGLAWVAQAVFDPKLRLENVTGRVPEVIMNLGLQTAAFIVILSGGQDLRRGVLYPVSRGQRAEVVWRASLARGFVAAWVPAIALTLAGVVSLLASGVDFPVRRVPEIFTALALTAALLPALQAGRLRFLERGGAALSSLAYSASVGVASAVFTGVHAITMSQVRELDPKAEAAVAFLLLPALFLAGQQLYRRWIRNWYATADLA